MRGPTALAEAGSTGIQRGMRQNWASVVAHRDSLLWLWGQNGSLVGMTGTKHYVPHPANTSSNPKSVCVGAVLR
jgi:hypothetical protein